MTLCLTTYTLRRTLLSCLFLSTFSLSVYHTCFSSLSSSIPTPWSSSSYTSPSSSFPLVASSNNGGPFRGRDTELFILSFSTALCVLFLSLSSSSSPSSNRVWALKRNRMLISLGGLVFWLYRLRSHDLRSLTSPLPLPLVLFASAALLCIDGLVLLEGTLFAYSCAFGEDDAAEGEETKVHWSACLDDDENGEVVGGYRVRSDEQGSPVKVVLKLFSIVSFVLATYVFTFYDYPPTIGLFRTSLLILFHSLRIFPISKSPSTTPLLLALGAFTLLTYTLDPSGHASTGSVWFDHADEVVVHSSLLASSPTFINFSRILVLCSLLSLSLLLASFLAQTLSLETPTSSSPTLLPSFFYVSTASPIAFSTLLPCEKNAQSSEKTHLPLLAVAGRLQEGAIKLEADQLNGEEEAEEEEGKLTLMEELVELRAWVGHCVRAGVARTRVMGDRRGVIQLV